MNMKASTAGGCGIVLAAVAFFAGMYFAPVHECPDDYWPHHAQTETRPPQQVADLLQGIFDKALADYGTEADPITKGKIKQCIKLTFECAWQDLTSHWGTDPVNEKKRADHIEAIQQAASFVNAGDWDNANKFLEMAAPIPGETIDHPH